MKHRCGHSHTCTSVSNPETVKLMAIGGAMMLKVSNKELTARRTVRGMQAPSATLKLRRLPSRVKCCLGIVASSDTWGTLPRAAAVAVKPGAPRADPQSSAWGTSAHRSSGSHHGMRARWTSITSFSKVCNSAGEKTRTTAVVLQMQQITAAVYVQSVTWSVLSMCCACSS